VLDQQGKWRSFPRLLRTLTVD